MDSLSTIAQIGSVCGTTVKLISSISDFTDSVQQGPKEVQALNNELASLYANFGQVKLAIQAPRPSGFPGKWKDDFDSLMKDCEVNLRQAEILVSEAKTSEAASSTKPVWKSIKFVFQSKQVESVRRRTVLQNGILSSLLAALAETRGSHIERALDEIHGKANELIESQAEI